MSATHPCNTATRSAGLDLLRLAAVILVIFNHATYVTELFPKPAADILEALRRGGWVGVDLFFVLSGYLVSGLLFSDHNRHGRAAIGNFLIRRGLKIYPAFWVLLAYTCFSILRREAEFSLQNLAGELLFLQNYVGYFWGHTWSLAVEEHFYLGLALLIALLQRRESPRPFNVVPVAFIGVAILCLSLRVFEAGRSPTFDWNAHLTPTHLRADSLFFGVLLAYGARYHGLLDQVRRFPPWLLPIVGITLFLPAFALERDEHRWLSTVGYNLFYLGGGLLVAAAAAWPIAPGRILHGAATVGAASYSIYLWHAPIGTWSSKLTRHENAWQDTAYLVAFLGCSLAGGTIMARLVELPVLRLRDRYFKSRSAPLILAPAPPQVPTTDLRQQANGETAAPPTKS